jgi:uncharacterized protein (DUF58 family)
MASSVLSPTVVAAIDDLSLAARLVVEGTRVGGHRSPLQGFSTEFRQHRPYQPGDDLKYLDWKAYARTDRLYTRQFRETTNLGVMLVLDTSASMAFPEEGVSKFRYATILAAALAHLLLTQGDAVGLLTMQDGAWTHLPVRGGPLHRRALIAQLDRLRPSGAWDAPRAIERSAELLARRGVIIVLSDFYDAEAETRRAMRRAQRRGHDVAMWQVIAPAERELPATGDHTFVDLESGVERVISARVARTAYARAMDDFLARCAHEAQRDGIEYALLSTDAPPERALRQLLLQRSSRAQAASPAASGA